MTLEQHIRNKTAKYIRPLLIKSECEVCKIENSLELHHIKPFAELLTECLSNLQLDKMTNIEDYNELELENIANYMLGVQLQTQYLTLCTQCHKEVHEEMGALCEIGDNFKLHYEKQEKIKRFEEEYRTTNVIIPYLDNVIDKKLYEYDRKITIDKIQVRDSRGRLQKSIRQLNDYFIKNKLPYIINSKIDKTRRLSDGSENPMRDKTYWTVTKNED